MPIVERGNAAWYSVDIITSTNHMVVHDMKGFLLISEISQGIRLMRIVRGSTTVFPAKI